MALSASAGVEGAACAAPSLYRLTAAPCQLYRGGVLLRGSRQGGGILGQAGALAMHVVDHVLLDHAVEGMRVGTPGEDRDVVAGMRLGREGKRRLLQEVDVRSRPRSVRSGRAPAASGWCLPPHPSAAPGTRRPVRWHSRASCTACRRRPWRACRDSSVTSPRIGLPRLRIALDEEGVAVVGGDDDQRVVAAGQVERRLDRLVERDRCRSARGRRCRHDGHGRCGRLRPSARSRSRSAAGA